MNFSLLENPFVRELLELSENDVVMRISPEYPSANLHGAKFYLKSGDEKCVEIESSLLEFRKAWDGLARVFRAIKEAQLDELRAAD